MHSLIHSEFAAATARERLDGPVRPGPTRSEPPPGRLRASAAMRLAALAGRLDREAARRAVA